MDEVTLHQFLTKLSAGNYSNDEYNEFTAWMQNCSRDEYERALIIWEEIVSQAEILPVVDYQLFEKIEASLDQLDRQENNVKQLYPEAAPRSMMWERIAVVACLLLTLAFGSYFYLKKKNTDRSAFPITKRTDPVVEHSVTLTLANGKKIILADIKTGKLAEESGVSITKASNGQLVYTIKESDLDVTGQYNTLTTPKGQTYQINLPDGSAVWLNAASTLRYPVRFDRRERRVQVTGEAYFEVAKDPSKPFRVNVDGAQEIEVLGTHFNVKAYGNDSNISTALLEGSVKLSSGSGQVILKPGQIAFNDRQNMLKVKQADLTEVMAWKNGLFVFNNENINEVMKTIARWYDVDFEFRGNVPQKRIWGKMIRYQTVTELLDNIAISTGIHYKITGRRVILTD